MSMLIGAKTVSSVRTATSGRVARSPGGVDRVMPASGDRRGVDDEAVADVGGEHSLIRLVDVLRLDDLDLCGDAVLGAEVEHLLRLRDAADHGPGERAPSSDQPHDLEAQRDRRSADV